MGKLTITTMVTLDGVMQAPGGQTEDTSGGFKYGGWVAPHFDDEGSKIIVENFSRGDAYLLGRGTYEIFASYWPKVTDPNDPVAEPLNRLPKHVVSRTLSKATWGPATIVRDVVREVGELKARYPRELQVHGSHGLCQTLISERLFDELHLYVFPVVVGSGKRLFEHGTTGQGLKLVRSHTTPSGVVCATYQPDGPVKTAEAAAPSQT